MRLRIRGHPRRRRAGRLRPGLPAPRRDLRERDEQDGQHVAGRPRRPARLPAPRQGQHDPGDPGPPDPLGAPVLRPVRRNRGAARGPAPSRRATSRGPAIRRPLRRAREGPAATARPGDVGSGGWRNGRSSAAWSGSGSGSSGVGCCTPATTGPRSRRGSGWRTRPWSRAIYGPSGDVRWDEDDPTYSLDAADRGGDAVASSGDSADV